MFLPTSKKEIKALGWDYIDVILITGDAYIDHPSFGIAIIARVLESHGFRVAVIPQPNWRDDLRDFKKLGAPRLFFGVSSGAMDSMVNHYTATKRLRSNDAYTVGGITKQRPDYALSVYTNILKKLYPQTPLIIGGIEASLRRFSHYDYWQNKVLPSMLIQCNADILVYGMGEKAIVEIAYELKKGTHITNIQSIPQTVYISNKKPKNNIHYTALHSHEECTKNKKAYAANFTIIEKESNSWSGQILVQKHDSQYIIANPPYKGTGITTQELDAIYALPYTRKPHIRYRKKAAIPAFEMIKNSVTIHRGCFGGCSFCTISAHQGKFVASRSVNSVLKEVETISNDVDFNGHITDLGGPSANMYAMQGENLDICKLCHRASCIFPEKCKNLDTNHEKLTSLYKASRSISGIKHITIGSGVRIDLLQNNKSSQNYLTELLTYHVSGRLKVAPEHTETHVLKRMRKAPFSTFESFKIDFERINNKIGKKQQLIPYFISSHPGCTKGDMRKLAQKLKTLNLFAEQVQDFTPTPMTLATTMYYTGFDPYTLQKVFVARTKVEKDEQKGFFFSHTKRK